MKIPDSIRIGGIEYPIKYTANLRHESSIAYGHISYDDCLIELSETDGTAHEKRCIILWHEILHGITEHAGLDFENADKETIVDTIAKGVYQVLQDNGGKLFDLVKRGEQDE